MPTGLQTDSSSCGFWSILFAWATLLGFEPHDPQMCLLQVQDLKDVLEVLWRGFLTPPGLTTKRVHDIFAPLGATVQWGHLKDIVSATLLRARARRLNLRRSQFSAPSASPWPQVTRAPPAVPRLQFRAVQPSVEDRADLDLALQALIRGDRLTEWRVGAYKFTVEQLRDFIEAQTGL